MCHSNGPRAIRPNYASPFNEVSLREKLKITYWNIRIKSYGRVIPHADHEIADKNLVRPFKFRSSYENEALKVATCIKCHKNSGFLARGELKRQNMPTIKFMLERGNMPPIGFSMSIEEKQQIQHFLAGF